MTDQDTPSDDTASPARGTWFSRRRKWPWIALLSVFVVPGLMLGLWTIIALNYTYSSGDRAGYIQKLSKKGWICKTWEGELAQVNVPGAMQEKFAFTVRNDSVAAEINKLQGRRVSLHYREHRGIPFSCMGETAHFVDGVRQVDEMGTVAVPPPAPAAPQPAPPGTGTAPSPAPR